MDDSKVNEKDLSTSEPFVASDLIEDEEMQRLIGVSLAIPKLLKQGLGVRQISELLNVPHTMIVGVAEDIGHKPTPTASVSTSKLKKSRKAQRKARKVNRA